MSSLPSVTWSRVPAPVICIPAYECFSLQSVGSGKRLPVQISIVRKTSWSLFLIATGLWTESDSFLCCIFSPLVFRTSIAHCSSFFFFFYLLGINLTEGVIIWRKIQQRKKTQSSQRLLHAPDLQIFYKPLHLVMCDRCVNPSPTVPNIQLSVWGNPVIRDLE